MKFLVASLFIALSFSVSAGIQQVPDCKDFRGNIMNGSKEQLLQVMRSNANRPQVMVTGVVSQILPEDHDGLPHQKYTITVDNIKLLVVSNLDFGRVPLQIGKSLTVCGEYKNVGQGMIHWTHFDPHGGHPDGFTVVDGQLYGESESTDAGAQQRQGNRR